MTAAEIVAAIDLRFRSANSVEVERAYIRREEWATLKEALRATKGGEGP